MRKVFLLPFIVVAVALFLLHKQPSHTTTVQSAEVATKPAATTQTFLFVPYWAVTDTKINSGSYDSLIYFGVSVNKQGLDTNEAGYKKIPTFLVDSDSTKNKLLTIRMVDSTVNDYVLTNKELQQKIITQSIATAKQYGFSGVVLDFEISAIAFDSVTNSITSFETNFAKQVKEQQLSTYITLYGDTFYRFRPFDTAAIAKQTDGIFIMAYDFHKASGQPGPNFPLSEKDTYGYDLQTMLADFEKHVPKEKINIVFGMFGYDWPVDSKGQPLGTATALSKNKIEQNFITTCTQKNCKQAVDAASGETKITYSDSKNQNHIIWFETNGSVTKKQDYLKQQGISNFATWAYSYF